MSIFNDYKDPILLIPNLNNQLLELRETVTIINYRVALQQIPDEFTRPTIIGYSEIHKGEPKEGQFLVDYVTGIVTFPSILENGTQLEVHYYGKGSLHISASRVFALHSKDESVIQNLQDIINNSQEGIDALASVKEASENLTHKGIFDSTLSYKHRNIVNYQGSAFMAIKDTVAGVLPTDLVYWEKLTAYSYRDTYSSITTYRLGDFVKDDLNENLYVFMLESGSGIVLSDTTAWRKVISVSDAVAYAKTQGDYALAQGNYAKTQGDYALTQGDYAKLVGDNLVHKGNYDSILTYKTGNIVYYDGITYMAISDTVSGTLPTDKTKWKKLNGQRWRGLYSSTETYHHGDMVIDSVNENIYFSIKDDNLNTLLTETTSWTNIISISAIVDYAQQQGDYAKTQGNYALLQGDYAKAQGNYAKTEADNLLHRGIYDSTVNYYPNNVVRYNGSAYMNIKASLSILPTDELYWKLLTEKPPIDTVNGKIGTVVLNSTDVGAVKNSGVPELITDLFTSRPAHGTAGRIFIAKDLDKLYRDTGTSWNEFKTEWANILNKPLATTSLEGLMSSGDKTKLDGIESGAINQITADNRYLKLAGGTMQGLFKLFGDPTDLLHPVTKQYADALKQGLATKDPVRVSTTTSIPRLSGHTQSTAYSIDGVNLVTGDRVLVKDGASADGVEVINNKRNGIYVVTISTSSVTNDTASFTRSIDADSSEEVKGGMYTWVNEGVSNKDSSYVLTNDGTITLGTTELIFAKFSGAGQINVGTGLAKSGDTIYIDDSGVASGTYTKVIVNAQGQVTGASNPTTLSGYGITDATPSSHIGSGGSSHALVTSTDAGFISSTDKSKLDSIASGAEVNQNAFSNLIIGLTTISADTATDSLEFIAGDSISLTADATNDKVTFSVALTDNAHGVRSGGNLHAVATGTVAGFMGSADKSKLDAIEAGATATAYPVVSETQPTTGLKEGLVWYKDSTKDTQMYIGGAFKHIGGVPPVISDTEPTTNLKEGLVWHKPFNKESKMYLNGDFQNLGGSTTGLVQYLSTVTLSADATSVAHGLQFDSTYDLLFVYKNSTFLQKGVDYDLNTDGTAIVSKKGTWLSGSEFNFVVIASVPTTNAFDFARLKNKFSAIGGETSISVGIAEFNPKYDKLDVYQNNVLLYEIDNYTVSSDGKTISLVGYSAVAGDVFLFYVWKMVRTNTNIMDGALIADGSIGNIKLATDIKVGSLATLKTTEKTSVTNAINELEDKRNNIELLSYLGIM
jgi:hypothetical protein